MKILYFHQHFSTPQGSTGTRSYEFARHLIACGHNVTMVCGQYKTAQTGLKGDFIDGRREGVVDGINVIEYALPYSNSDSFIKRTITFLKFSLRTLREVFFQNYDLLFSTSTPLTAAIPGIVMKIFRKKKFVFEVRDLWPELPREMGVITNPIVLKLMDWLEWTAYRSADICIGLSPGICSGITRRGVPEFRVHMIPNGCDLNIFEEGFESKTVFNDSRITEDSTIAIFTGAHGIANGLDAALNAASVLKSKGRSDIFLIFIGEGREKPRLVKRAKEENLNNCLFMDSVSKIMLSKMMKASDIGMMLLQNVPAFYYGTSPNKFFDYISAGRPVLNNYPGWVADMISEYNCGIAVPPDDPLKFAEALIDFADSKAKLLEMGKNSLILAKEKFSRNELAGKFEKVLSSI